jgi:hypothetical protein
MKQIKYSILYIVSKRTFVIPFYFGSVSKSRPARAKVPAPTGSGSAKLLKALHIPSHSRADIQRRGSTFFAVLEEIYNNGVPHWSAVLISCNHSITRLISVTKNALNQK